MGMIGPERYIGSANRSNIPLIGVDAAGRLRTSALSTLGDYKQIGYEKTLLFSTAGNGMGAWANNKYTMSVVGNQYQILESSRVHPYLSGKSQPVEITFDGFQHESGVTKRVGYFSSSIAAPHTGSFDGFFLESDGQNYFIKAYRDGTETIIVPDSAWDNWADVSKYDWSMFTVIMFDFLWLGGAVLRFWVKTSKGFVLVHTEDYAGSARDTFTLSPSQPLRCEIRGANSPGGQMRFICAQVATEGDVTGIGIGGSVNTDSPEITLAAVDTTYPVISIRKQAALRTVSVELTGVDLGVGSVSDRGVWSVQINPTLSAPLTYGDIANSPIQKANGDGVITVTSPGYILASGHVATNILIPRANFQRNFLTRLGGNLTGTMDEYVLCLTNQTATISATGYMDWKEY